MLERVFLPQTDSIDDLRRIIEKSINGLVARYNREENQLQGVLDAKQNRIINLGRPVRGADAVPLSYLNEILRKRSDSNKLIQLAEGGVSVGAHADRPSTGELGSLFYESDREVLYVFDGTDWKVIAGQMRGTLSPNQKPSDLNSGGDTGFLFFSTDFHHTFRWDGAAWELADPGDPPGRISMFAVAPGDGWKLLDGSGNPFTYSTPTGGTATISVDDLDGFFPKFGGTFTGTTNSAVAPTGSTDSEDSHTHSNGSLATSTPIGTTVVQSGAGVTVASASHVHDVTGDTNVGSAHSHNITMNADGQPPNIVVLPYFRL